LLIDNYLDKEYRYELYLCNPSSPYAIKGCLTNATTDRRIVWQLRQPDELSFKIYKTFEDGSDNSLFEEIEKSSVVRLEKYVDNTLESTQLFHISNLEFVSDITEYKQIQSYSLEIRMNKQSVRDFEFFCKLYTGTWNVNDIENSGIVDYILTLFKGNWTVDYITTGLASSSRSFNISNARVLEAIRTIEEEYNCIFIFNTDVQTIDIVEFGDTTYNDYFTNNGIILDSNNYVDQYRSQIDVDEIVTRLFVEGANNTNIASVNILGEEYIDDFSFFKNTKYMTQGLITALNSLDSLRQSEESNYQTLLTNLSTKFSELAVLLLDLANLGGALTDNDPEPTDGQLQLIQDKMDIAIKTGQAVDGKTYSQWKTDENNKLNEISSKKSAIQSKNNEIQTIQNNISSLQNSISYESNLTSTQLKELSNFIQEGNVKFETDQPLELLDLGKAYLIIKAQSQYDIQVDMVDVFSSSDDSYTWDKIQLAKKVNLILTDDQIFEPFIVSIEHSYDSNQLKITVSNKTYLNDDLNYLSAIWAKFNSTTTIVDNNKTSWDKAEDVSNEFEEYIKSPITSSNTKIKIGDEDGLIQQAQINRRGIYLRDNENANGQMRIFSDRILFTNNNWNPDPITGYGGYSVGITSNGITTDGSFKLISDGAFGGKNLITIDGNKISIYGDGTANSGIEIYNASNQKVMGFDSSGNLTMTGKLTIQSGSTGISSFGDAGDLATLDSIDYSSSYLTGTKPPADADRTQTIINGGLITTGRIELGTSGTINAGINGSGTSSSDIRFWAGDTYANRGIAPFRVTQNGTVTMTNADVVGKIRSGLSSDLTTAQVEIDNLGTFGGRIALNRGTGSNYTIQLQEFNYIVGSTYNFRPIIQLRTRNFDGSWSSGNVQIISASNNGIGIGYTSGLSVDSIVDKLSINGDLNVVGQIKINGSPFNVKFA
jgi:hypothetical protein